MTYEAKSYLQELFDKDPSKFMELCGDKKGITHAILNQEALTEEEIEHILHLVKNGSPTITIEYREGYVRTPISLPSFKENENLWPPRPKIHISFSEKEIKQVEWSYMNERDLSIELAKAEANEDYKLCAEIRDYAKSKEIDLKR